jgi:hypothetical protein
MRRASFRERQWACRQAGLLASASSSTRAFPSAFAKAPADSGHLAGIVGGYSCASATDFHRLPMRLPARFEHADGNKMAQERQAEVNGD